VTSILTDVKQTLGLDEAYVAFDLDVLMHINSAFATLNQLGIGPAEGFMIEDATPEWDAFLGDDLKLNSVKTYIYLSVRLVFDPPTTSYLIDSLRKQLDELTWRINTYREDEAWVDPDPPPPEEP
jgi:hypothetical protein